MRETTERLAGRLEREGQKTLDFFRGLAPERWGLTVYTEGSRWTIRQVLAHFVASEYSLGRLVEDIAAGGMGAREDFDLNGYNEHRVAKLEAATVDELLAQFGEQRRMNVEQVRTMAAEDLSRQGRHPFLGVAPLDEIIQMIYRHNQIHQREIRKAVSSVEGEIQAGRE